MELYERYHRPLYQAAYSILKNREDAQDAMQEGMIRAFEKLDQYQGEGSFEGWLRKIVIRKSITGSGDIVCYGNPEKQQIKTTGSGGVLIRN